MDCINVDGLEAFVQSYSAGSGGLQDSKKVNLPIANRKQVETVARANLQHITKMLKHDDLTIEAAAACFKSLYLLVSTYEETVELVRMHQLFIIKLISLKHWRASVHHLNYLYHFFNKFIHGKRISYTLTSKIFDGISYSNLDDPQILKLVIAWHFFLFQVLVHFMSNNVKLMINDTDAIWNSSSLESMANSFLVSSNFRQWMNLASKFSVADFNKYHKNSTKIIRGLLKITDTVLKYSSNDDRLIFLRTCFILKLIEFDNDLSLKDKIIIQPEHVPFVDDLRNHPLFSEVSTRLNASSNSNLNVITVLTDLVQSRNPKLINTLHLQLINTQANTSGDKKVIELIKGFCLDSTPISFAFVDVITSFLESSKVTTAHFVIIDPIIMFMKDNIENTDYHHMMYSSLFKLFNSLKGLNQFKRLRNISNLLYNMGNRSKNSSFWKTSVDIEAEAIVSNFNKENFLHLVSKAQKVGNALLDLKYYNEVKAILKSVILVMDQFQANQEEVDCQTLTQLLCKTLSNDMTFVSVLFQGLSESTKIKLTINMFQFPINFKDIDSRSKLFNIILNTVDFDQNSRLVLAYYYYMNANFDNSSCIDPSSTNDLLVAGICLKKLTHHWKEDVFIEAIESMEKWLTNECNVACSLEADIFKSFIQNLKLNGASSYIIKFIKLYQLKRNLDSSISVLMQLELCQAQINLSQQEANDSITKLNSILKDFKVNTVQAVISYNLLQFEYSLSIFDVSNAQERFNKILKFLASREEFKLSYNKNPNLMDRFGNLLLVAKFQYLTSKLNVLTKNHFDAYSSCKICIKLLYSVFRNSMTNISEDKILAIKCDTSLLLFSSLKLMMKILLHLGITRDLLYYLNEFEKLTETNATPIYKAQNTLYTLIFYYLLGEEESIQTRIDTVKSLCRITLIASDRSINKILRKVFLLLQHEDGQSTEELDQNLIQISNFEHCDFDFSYLSSLRANQLLVYDSDPTSFESRILQSKIDIISSVRLLAQLPGFLDLNDCVISIPCVSNDGELDSSRLNTSILDNLIRCKNVLLSGLDIVGELSTYALKDFYKVVNHCLLCLSSMTVCKLNSTLLMDLFYLQDFANTIPFRNDKLLNHASSGIDDLLPKSTTMSIENTDFKLLSTNFNVDLNLYLPENWTILSIDFCQTTGNLLISKYAKGFAPFFLNLPLKRHNSRNIEVYSFLEVMNKFNQLIKQSNASTKSSITSNIVTKADRKEWWKLRFGLDLELKELLQHVEDFWFGGFKSVFNNLETDTVFKKFKTDFIGMLNKLLPSRRQSDKQFMQFDDNLISLFYEADMNDKSGLDDLVYFLIDSLSLHGEVNSFDDIPANFIESIQKLIDKYHNIRQPLKNEHVVLIPGAKCSFFPWESMNSLRNKSVSRVPSVSMLLDMLKQRKADMKVNNKSNTYYLINPGGDLLRTEQRFREQFIREERWAGLIGREPQDDQLLLNLMRLELFVYLGHGGCDQYMKTSTLYRTCLGNKSSLVPTLPPSLLIGCSSGALQMNGFLEPNGNVYNWLTCGSPMVMANLWDVTDKDIDLFAKSIFEKWGLFNSDRHETICSAVKKSRDFCTLKYLNGSAPVIYGLPLFIN